MKINVQYQLDEGTPITCEYNDFCNHAGAVFDDWAVNLGTFEDRRIVGAMVCNKCEAYNYIGGEYDWQYDV